MRFLVFGMILFSGFLSGSARGQQASANGASVRWYGHAFVYLTSSTGTRIAIDPFGTDVVSYDFPARLPADVVLVTNELDDHAAADRLFGSPLVFRGVTAVGLNKGPGLLFKGVMTFKDNQRGAQDGENTVYKFEVDGVSFAHLGVLGHPLDSRMRDEIGTVDVLFLPVGLPMLDRPMLDKIVAETGAKIIVPLNYKTSHTGDLSLRSLGDYLQGQKLTVKQIDDASFSVTRDTLPAQPTIYVLKSP